MITPTQSRTTGKQTAEWTQQCFNPRPPVLLPHPAGVGGPCGCSPEREATTLDRRSIFERDAACRRPVALPDMFQCHLAKDAEHPLPPLIAPLHNQLLPLVRTSMPMARLLGHLRPPAEALRHPAPGTSARASLLARSHSVERRREPGKRPGRRLRVDRERLPMDVVEGVAGLVVARVVRLAGARVQGRAGDS